MRMHVPPPFPSVPRRSRPRRTIGFVRPPAPVRRTTPPSAGNRPPDRHGLADSGDRAAQRFDGGKPPVPRDHERDAVDEGVNVIIAGDERILGRQRDAVAGVARAQVRRAPVARRDVVETARRRTRFASERRPPWSIERIRFRTVSELTYWQLINN